jgi:hypothetical protein
VTHSPEDGRSAHTSVGLNFLRCTRLADPGLTDEHHELAAASERGIGGFAQPIELLLTSDEHSAGEAIEDVGI